MGGAEAHRLTNPVSKTIVPISDFGFMIWVKRLAASQVLVIVSLLSKLPLGGVEGVGVGFGCRVVGAALKWNY